jgi:hypothetical protein
MTLKPNQKKLRRLTINNRMTPRIRRSRMGYWNSIPHIAGLLTLLRDNPKFDIKMAQNFYFGK